MRRSVSAVVADSGPVAILAAIAAAGSFTHIRDTAREHGQGGPMAWAIAVCIDLTCVMAARERQRDKRTGRPTGLVSWPTLVLIGGILLSLAANLAQAEPTKWGWVVAGTPAVAFLVAVSMLERRATMAHDGAPVAEPPAATVARHDAPMADIVADLMAEPVARHDAPSVAPVAEPPAAIVARHDAPSARTTARQKTPRRGPSRTDKTRVEAAAILITQPDISGAELGRQVGVSARTGARLKNDLSGQPAKELSHSL